MKIKKIITLLAFIIGVQAFAGTHTYDAENTKLHWYGSKIGGAHEGSFSLKTGELKLKSGEIVGGHFIIDMNSIKNTDIENDGYREKLIGHLKSDDFFGVNNYPEAHLKINSATEFKDDSSTVTADLTIKGQTHPVEFQVVKDESSYDAKIIVDRTEYDIRYGSGKFFKGLGDKLIHDEFTITVKLSR